MHLCLKPQTAAIAAVLSITLGGVTVVRGQSAAYDITSLNGSYAYSISGNAADPSNGANTLIAEAGRLTADGAGNLSGSSTVIISGSVVRRSLTGSYAVNPDGTGALLLNPSWGPAIHADLVIGERGHVVRLVLTDAGNTISGAIVAQVAGQTAPPSGYGAAILNGGYEYKIGGSAADFNGNVTPISEVGRLTADGAGNLTGSSTVSINGSIVRRTLTGAYTVNPDGSGSVTMYPSWGPAIHADLFVSVNGLKVDFVVTDSGSTLSGAMTAQAVQTQ